jgi:hypothetical protein
MFEQIKKCRYIRHYHPRGSQSDDEDIDNLPQITETRLTFNK